MSQYRNRKRSMGHITLAHRLYAYTCRLRPDESQYSIRSFLSASTLWTIKMHQNVFVTYSIDWCRINLPLCTVHVNRFPPHLNNVASSVNRINCAKGNKLQVSSDWSIDRLIDWLIDSFIHSLIDWLIINKWASTPHRRNVCLRH